MNHVDRLPTFHFFTLVTKTDQYDAMRESLARVGFDEANSVFTVLDNRESNEHEPYSAINEAVRTAQAPHVVFCHQDLLFHQGPEALLDAIRQVQERDPQWAVLGNTGHEPNLELAICLEEKDGMHRSDTLPAKVLTLDENFLVIRRDAGVGCSPELAGFHLYATDLCLNAYLKGRSAWVIDFHVLHLTGTLDYTGLHKLAWRFRKVWRRKISGAVVMTPSATLLFSRVPLVFRMTNRVGIHRQFCDKRHLARAFDYLSRRGRPRWLPSEQTEEDAEWGPRFTVAVRTLDRLLGLGRRSVRP